MYSIYIIVNLKNFKLYIGKTINFEKRKKRHITDLKRGKHHSEYLQRSFNKHGLDQFDFIVIEENISEENVCELEEKLIFLFGDYNVSLKSSGGDNTSYHPRNKEIRKKLSESSKTVWSNRSDDYREQPKLKIIGKKNPMYGKNHTEETKKLMSDHHYTKKKVLSRIIRVSQNLRKRKKSYLII